MKEEWKVFIRGNSDRGDEVIKALTDLGADNSVFGFKYKGNDSGRIYFINHNGIVSIEYDTSEYAKIIMDNYKEINLPEKWHDGDILIDEISGEFAVFCHYSDKDNCFLSYVSTTNQPSFKEGRFITSSIYRKATKEEIERFHKVLHKCSRYWDEVNKTLVYWRWHPKDDDKYYYICPTGDIESCIYDKTCFVDEKRCEFGNCFPTRYDALKASTEIKKLLREKVYQ